MTQREIAEQLHISPATLSLVLNNKPGISSALRQRVLNDLISAGYSNLIKGGNPAADMKNIAFILFRRNGRIVDYLPFSSLVTKTIYPYIQLLGYNMILSVFDLQDDVSRQIEVMRNYPCAGAVVFATEMTAADITYFTALPYPCVFMDNFLEKSDVDCVATNSRMGTFQAVELLMKLGHRRVGYLKNEERTDMLKEREEGFELACLECGIEFCKDWQLSFPFISELVEKQLKEQLPDLVRERGDLPTAFVSDDDIIATGAVRGFEAAGYAVPDDVSVIGFANRPVAEYGSMALTSVEVKKGVGLTAAKRLFQRIENRNSGEDDSIRMKIRIGTDLIIRDSTRKS